MLDWMQECASARRVCGPENGHVRLDALPHREHLGLDACHVVQAHTIVALQAPGQEGCARGGSGDSRGWAVHRPVSFERNVSVHT